MESLRSNIARCSHILRLSASLEICGHWRPVPLQFSLYNYYIWSNTVSRNRALHLYVHCDSLTIYTFNNTSNINLWLVSLNFSPWRTLCFFHEDFFQESPFFSVLRLFVVVFFQIGSYFNSSKILTLNFFHPHQSFQQLKYYSELNWSFK